MRLRRTPELPRPGERAAVVLPSGRTLTTAVRQLADDGALTLDAPPGPLQPGEAVELRWAAGERWCSLDCRVAPPAGDLLRLQPAGRPRGERERRSGRRRAALALVELTVLRGADVVPGTRLREWVVDVGESGLAFDSDLALAPGDQLRVDLLPDGRGAIAGGGAHVVRRERPPGALQSRVAIVLDDPPAGLARLLGHG